jgi:hypothetical protein
MRPGDEKRSMSVIERITDEPLDPEPYIDYCIDNWNATKKFWKELPDEGPRPDGRPSTKECVLAKIDDFLIELDDIKRKMHRPE